MPACHSTSSKFLFDVAKENYETEMQGIERAIDRYEALILEVARVKRFDLAIWIEGSDTQFGRGERDLSVLERANLVGRAEVYTPHRIS
jgi:hypothetical protein